MTVIQKFNFLLLLSNFDLPCFTINIKFFSHPNVAIYILNKFCINNNNFDNFFN